MLHTLEKGQIARMFALALALVGLALACCIAPQSALAQSGQLAQGSSALLPADDTADFCAVLHDDGELVFQKDASDEEGTVSFASSLANYSANNKAPWLEQAHKILSVRFDESFAAVAPKSTAFWFYGCSRLERIDLANLDASQSTSFRSMFSGCSSLVELANLDELDTSSSTYFGSMFRDCKSLTSLDLSHFDATHVQVLCFMFNGCTNLKTLDITGPKWNTPALHLMVHVFENCSSLEELDLSSLDTSHVTSMTHDFDGCTSLRTLNLSNVDTTSMNNMAAMFDNCPNLSTVTLGAKFSFCGKDTERKCSLPEGRWRSSAGGTYAHDAIPNNKAATYRLVTGEDDWEDTTDPTSGEDGESAGGGGDTASDTSSPNADATGPAGSSTPNGDAAASPASAGKNGTSASSGASAKANGSNGNGDSSTSAKPTAGQMATKAIGMKVGKKAIVAGSTYTVTSNSTNTVKFAKAPKAMKKVVIPASVIIGGKKYAVTGIAAKAFKATKVKTLVVKTKKLTRKNVSGCFKGAKHLKTVKVPKGKKKAYTDLFAKSNSGRAVSVRAA